MYAKDKKIVQEIALRLQEVRQQTGLSIKEMAAQLGVTRDGYAKNERGQNILNIDSLKRLGQKFNISMDWLLFNRGPSQYKEKGKREQELEIMVDEMTRAETGLRSEAAAMQQEVEELKRRLEIYRQEESEAIELKGEVEGLKSRLAEEYKKQEMARQEGAKVLEMNPEVRELLDYMAQDPVFYHRLMLNFQEFRTQQKKIDATTDVSLDISREPPKAEEGESVV